MKWTRRHIVLVCFAAAGAAVWAGFARARRESDRAALRRMYDGIQIGDSRTAVAEAFSRYRTETISLDDRDDRLWIIAMPLEFGATNWQILVEFASEKVTHLRLRTADGPPPRDGPPDKGASNGR